MRTTPVANRRTHCQLECDTGTAIVGRRTSAVSQRPPTSMRSNLVDKSGYIYLIANTRDKNKYKYQFDNIIIILLLCDFIKRMPMKVYRNPKK